MNDTVAYFSILCLLLCMQTSYGVVRRDDVADSEYIALSTLPEYESVGYWHPSTKCANGSGGALISPQWVLTAAHCIPTNSTSTGEFSLGPSATETYLNVSADEWMRNPSYNNDRPDLGHDFGLVHLSEPVLEITPAQLFRSGSEAGQIATFVGYGQTGTGLTGRESGTQGTRRAATNRIDGFGGSVGWSSNVFVGDFDNPNDPGDSVLGPNTPTDMEGMIALNDSGGGWFIEIGGIQYLVGVSSFVTNLNSDYGVVFGNSRVIRDLTWIDENADVANFFTAFNGSWTIDGNWDAGNVPNATTTAVVKQGTVAINTPASAEYLFVDDGGRVRMNAQLNVEQVMVKRDGVFQVGFAGGGVQILFGNYKQTDGIYEFYVHAPIDRGSLAVISEAQLNGQLKVRYGSGYAGPSTRGQIDLHQFITASSVQGEFDTVDGIPIGTTMTYAGETAGGLDGLFRALTYTDTQVTLTEYLALPGDANGDGNVDVSDFNIWNQNRFVNGTDWLAADFNGDGATDLADLNIWNENKGTTVNLPFAVQVPEPNSVFGGILGLVVALRCYRSRVRHSTRC